jgi:Bacterial toxin 5
MQPTTCHFPITVRVVGTLGDEHLDSLAAHVERAVTEQIAAADRQLARLHGHGLAVVAQPSGSAGTAEQSLLAARPDPRRRRGPTAQRGRPPAQTRRPHEKPDQPAQAKPSGVKSQPGRIPVRRPPGDPVTRLLQLQTRHGTRAASVALGQPPAPPIATPVPGINKVGFIDHSDGANIRTGPLESGGRALRAAPLPPATQVFVSGTHPDTPQWLYVTAFLPAGDVADSHQMEMIRGYVQDFRVTTDLPEPLAKLHQVKQGDTAERLASAVFHTAIRDGHDLRYYENVLFYVNNVLCRRAGVIGTYQDPGLFGGGANNVQLVAGHRIWLVSPAFARALEGIVPSGSLTGGAVAKARRLLRRIEDILESIAESRHHLGEVAGEYLQAIHDHMAEIIGIIAAFLMAEAASIAFAAVPGGQLVAALIQLALSAFGAAGAAQAGLEALKHADAWLTLAWNASGNEEKIAAASKEFLRMLVSIAMAALAYTGAKANLTKAVEIASSLPPRLVPAMVFARGGQQAPGLAGTVAKLGIPGPAGPVGNALARTIEGEETTPPPPEKPTALKPSVLPEYSSKNSFMNAMRRQLLAQRAAGKPSVLDFLLDGQGQWQKGTFLTKRGGTIRGRYALSNPDAPLVQAGHLQSDVYAKAAGKREYLMLEDADLNWLTGQVSEAKGAYVSKPAVMIDRYPIDIPTARLYESHGLLPAGTVDAAPVIEPPEF